jgi:protein-tyrosine phosphatase
MSASVRVCFVCLGNICRSPTAEGVLLAQLRAAGLDHAVAVDSAGTAAYHVGERPDPRTLAAAARRGYELPSVARQFVRADFARFTHVLAMDRQNLAALERLRGGGGAVPSLLRSFEPDADAPDVPDPYYGGAPGFEQVLDICERACAGFLTHLRKHAGI